MNSRGRRTALIVTPRYLPLLGGMERECALLADAFDHLDIRTTVVTERPTHGFPRIEQMGPAKVVRIPSSPNRTLVTQLRVAVQLALFLARNRRNFAFAVVRTFTLPALVVGLMKRLRIIRFPTLVTAETGGDQDDVVMLRQRPLAQLSRWIVSGHDVINGICSANVTHMLEFGLPAEKISSIPNGIDVAAWASTSPPEKVRRFLFLGRVEESKGVGELLEAFRELRATDPEVSLTFAGEGDALAGLERDGLGAGVRVLGRVPYQQLDELFATHDCLVLPSYSEGMPLSVLEAAARHRVLVLSDVGDMGVRFAGAAHVCQPANTASLLAALEAARSATAPTTPYEDVIKEVDINAVAKSIVDRLAQSS